MTTPNIEILKNFSINNIPNLDIAVLGALELFQQRPLPKIDVSGYHHPLIVGSGNAEAAGRIIFESKDAIFASESNYEEKLRDIPSIDGVVLLSASGGKHSPEIARISREHGKHVTLLTNTLDSPADSQLDHLHENDEYVFPKNREPYTYNTSTYMGMILGATAENPAEIEQFIKERIDTLTFPDFSTFNKYYLIVPPEFSGIIRMLQVKFIELFGRNIARDVETSEYVRHATTVVPSDELFICFGEPNTTWGGPNNRLNVPLPKNAGYGAMMAIGYYVIAQIQKAHPDYFKDNIEQYIQEVSKIFKEDLSAIVDN